MIKRQIVASRPLKTSDINLSLRQHSALCQFANVIMSDLESKHLDTLSDTDIFCLKQLEECGLLTKRDISDNFAGQPRYTNDHTYLENSKFVALCKVAKIITWDIDEQLGSLSQKEKVRVRLLEECGFLAPSNLSEGILGQSIFTKIVTIH